MVFSSYDFLFFFLPAVFLCYRVSPPAYRNGVLVLASYFFYGYWNVRYIWLLFFSSGANFLLGNQIFAAAGRQRRPLFVFAVTVNLALLFAFKYAGFFAEIVSPLFGAAQMAPLKIVLPIGISFFTFQGMSYVTDIYRGLQRPARSFLDFSCYLTMFPQLIAGPIVRFQEIADRLRHRPFLMEDCIAGLRLFIIGLAKKVLVADAAASLLPPAGQQAWTGGAVAAWTALIAFSLQIYFDFAGYSDMAVGLGRIFGFRFPENFRHPYKARGIADFWRRWHMTLSGWLRDYLYIPLGGSRCSSARRTANLLLTMTLCGLWHGAARNFVLWGAYHGLLLAVERPFRDRIAQAPAWIAVPMTTLVVDTGWVVFRAADLAQAGRWFRALVTAGQTGGAAQATAWAQLGAVVLPLVLCWVWPEKISVDTPFCRAACDIFLVLLLAASFVAICGGGSSPFLYYQF